MHTAFEIGNQVKTYTGTRDCPAWVYGIIADIIVENGDLLYRVDYGDGSYDWMHDFELKIACT